LKKHYCRRRHPADKKGNHLSQPQTYTAPKFQRHKRVEATGPAPRHKRVEAADLA
jgi:hypothetical protein